MSNVNKAASISLWRYQHKAGVTSASLVMAIQQSLTSAAISWRLISKWQWPLISANGSHQRYRPSALCVA